VTATIADNFDLGNGYLAEIDQISEQNWNKALSAFDDATVYQSWAYGAVRSGRASRLVLRKDGEIVGLAQMRLYIAPIVRSGLAYLHWGPLWRKRGKDPDIGVLSKIVCAVRDEYAIRRGLYLWVRPAFYDIEEGAAEVARVISESQLVRLDTGGRVLCMDLRASIEHLRRGLAQKWRNQLNAAERNGLTIATGTGEDLLEAFVSIHAEMATRKRLSYGNSMREFVHIFRALPTSIRPSVVLCRRESQLLAGAVISTLGSMGIYLFGATSNNGLQLKASNLVQWHCVRVLKELGALRYDLTSINPERNPGTYHFKAGLCGKNGGEARPIGEYEFSGSRLSTGLIRGLTWTRFLTRR